MGHRGVGVGGDDGGEAHAVGPEGADAVFEEGGDLGFGLSGFDKLEHFSVSKLLNAAGFDDEFDLVGSFDGTLVKETVVKGLETPLAELLDELIELGEGDVVLLNADAVKFFTLGELIEFLREAFLTHDRRQMRRFTLNLLMETRVAEDNGLAAPRGDEGPRVVADETGEVPGIDGVDD